MPIIRQIYVSEMLAPILVSEHVIAQLLLHTFAQTLFAHIAQGGFVDLIYFFASM
jgi:hypothetical protein